MAPKQLPTSWIFQYNLRDYDFQKAVEYLSEVTFPVGAYTGHVMPGDTAYLWETSAGGGVDGVTAVCRVHTEPAVADELEDERPFISTVFQGRMTRVRLSIELVMRKPYLRRDIQQHPWLKKATVLTEPARSVILLTQQQGKALNARTVNRFQKRYIRITPDLRHGDWATFLQDSCCYISWDKTGDLRAYQTKEQLFSAMLPEAGGGTTAELQTRVDQLWTLRELRAGDRIVLTNGNDRVLSVGTVKCPWYEWRDGRHLVNLVWHDVAFPVEPDADWQPCTIGELAPRYWGSLGTEYVQYVHTNSEVSLLRLQLKLKDYWRQMVPQFGIPGEPEVHVGRLTMITCLVFQVAYGRLDGVKASSLTRALDGNTYAAAMGVVLDVYKGLEFPYHLMDADRLRAGNTRPLDAELRKAVKQKSGMTINKLLPPLNELTIQ